MKSAYYALKTLRRYRKDEGGNIAMIFGFIFVLLIACVGAGYDMNQLVSTKQKASSIADTTALTAAVFYSSHNRTPLSPDEGYMDGHEYDATAMTYSFNSLSTKQADNVKIKVTYDLVNKEATSHVYGDTKVAFMQVFGYNKLGFTSSAVAKFSEVELKDPASVMLVLDNSGSMSFDDKPNDPNTGANPPEAQRRITALESSVSTFMDQLDDIAGPQTTPAKRFLRTGMKTYSSNLLNTTVDMKWGVLTNAEITSMTPGGGTNSSPPMQAAAADLVLETDAHKNDKFGTVHYPGDEPLKFLVFMTDGQNNNDSSLDQWEASAGTQLWRRWETQEGYNQWTCHWWGCHNHWIEGSSGWSYEEGETSPPGNGWQEGLMTGNLDRLTRITCDAMRADGVRVYSVGFALEDGTFDTNEWGNAPNNPDTWYVSKDVKRAAVHMMKACAGVEYPQRFLLAEDAASLDAAFVNIGLDIVKEIIRLSM